MIKHLAILSLVVGLSFAHAEKALLFSPDRPLPVIVLAADAEDQEQYAAEDLKNYLGRMTGREWTIAQQAPAEGVAIHIGKVPGNEALREEAAKLGRDGFVLDVSEGAVRVAGGTKFGTAYGVFELLERLGVRWFFPGEWGEVVPKKEELRLETTHFSDRPVFRTRQMHTAYSGDEIGDWMRRSRHNRNGYYGHSSFIRPRDYKVSHPEWYAEIDGVRQVDNPNYKLCHSNDAMVETLIREVLEKIREREADGKVARHDGYRHLMSDYDTISISPKDGGGFCRCEKCAAMGTLSDRLQIVANRVAERVREVYPNYRIGYYGAYAEHHMSPTVKANAGVVVIPTTWTRNFFKPLTDISNRVFLKKLQDFKEMAPQMILRDFDGLSVWWGAGPLSLADVHAADYQLYAQMELEGIITEAGSGWGPWGYSYYLMGKLWWNPKADLKSLKEDFVSKAYGEAAGPMRTYYELLDHAVASPGPRDLHTMRVKLEEAAKLAKDEGVKQRVNYLRAHFLMDDIYQRSLAREATPEEVELFHQLNASIPPSVSPYTKSKRFLRNFPEAKEKHAPLTEAELEAQLAKVKLTAPEREFTAWVDQDDLRLQPLEPEAAAVVDEGLGMSLRFGPATLLIYAKAGETIDLRQTSKRWESYGTAYEIQNPELVTIAEGVAEGETILNLQAPSTGIYKVELSFGSRYPNLLSSNRHIVLKAGSRQNVIQPMGAVKQAFFYVPAGTKEFAIVSRAYEPLTIRVEGAILRPNPQPPIRQKTQSFVTHLISVPEGADGKVWKVAFEGGKKDLFLQGVPPFIASNPSRLLVPERITKE